jgi:hypothetical protein
MALAQTALDTLQGRVDLARAITAPRAGGPYDADGRSRVQAIHCPDGLAASGETCRIETDPRGAGLAIGSN